ncbi:MAG: M48 family metalloprotease [Desulfobacterales bacterium]|jgi:Zn-dependent protease with chaperone function|nr:M48 family metalloprotease [Desulfobacterales bacterium]
MFGNFIHFIVVLLIYATYQPVEETNFSLVESLFLFVCLAILFAGQTWVSFHNLEKRVHQDRLSRLDHRFSAIVLRQSVLAIGLFAVDIYGLNITSFLSALPFFSMVPTLQALCCLGIYIGYLSIIWSCAHTAYRQIYPTRISRASYVGSNITFSVPVLIPWLVLSALADLIQLLPFEFTRHLFSTTWGQVSYFLIFMVVIALVGPTLIQIFWRCKPLENNSYRELIEARCRKAGITYNDIVYWPIFGGSMITAGVMGLVGKFRYILVTKSLLRYLSSEELDAVIAHEIGHVKKHHLLFYLMFFTGFMFLSLATQNVFLYAILYTQPIYRLLTGFGVSAATITSALDALLFILIFIVYFRYLFGFFMRNFERQADAYVYTQLDSAGPLVSTLKKIGLASGQPMDKPNWHHFSIGERIRFLETCETDRSRISRHDRKIKTGIAAYILGFFLIGSFGYQLQYSEGGKTFYRETLIRYIESQLKEDPSNPAVLKVLGLLYTEKGDQAQAKKEFDQAVTAYEQSLRYDMHNPYALNNLAWLYATSEAEKFRNPQRALSLALAAARLERSAQILDTLAECYYINGDKEAAISAATEALRSATENRNYFQDQLERFKR